MGRAAQKCSRCRLTKPLDQFAKRTNGSRRSFCNTCLAPITCTRCSTPRERHEYTEYRLGRSIFVCNHCDPPTKGRRVQREYDPNATYKCAGCNRSLSADYYTLRNHPSGRQTVKSRCRMCLREEKWYQANGHNAEEERLRSDALYDYTLAKTMFGFTHEEAVDWIVKGYKGKELTADRLEAWGMTPNTRAIWAPDPIGEEAGD